MTLGYRARSRASLDLGQGAFYNRDYVDKYWKRKCVPGGAIVGSGFDSRLSFPFFFFFSQCHNNIMLLGHKNYCSHYWALKIKEYDLHACNYKCPFARVLNF